MLISKDQLSSKSTSLLTEARDPASTVGAESALSIAEMNCGPGKFLPKTGLI